MFERYTEKARRVIFFARYEASQFGSPYIETEHLLLGLLRENMGLATKFLTADASEGSFRGQIESQATIREKVPTHVDLPLSNECKRVLAYAAEDAIRLGHKFIGPEHLLLGMLREKGCFAELMLTKRGADLKRIREGLAEAPPDPPIFREPPRLKNLLARFSQQATSAVIFAMYEASRAGSPQVETEHLLLSLLHEDKPTIDRLLGSDIAEDSIRNEIDANGPVENQAPMNLANMPLIDEAKRVLAYAVEEADRLKNESAGIEHLLLGLLREERCFAAQMLQERGADFEEIWERLSGEPPAA